MKFTTYLPKIHLNIETPVYSRTLGEAGHGKKTLLWAVATAVSSLAYIVFGITAVFLTALLFSPTITTPLIAIPVAAAAITCFALYALSIAASAYSIVRCFTHLHTLLTDAPKH